MSNAIILMKNKVYYKHLCIFQDGNYLKSNFSEVPSNDTVSEIYLFDPMFERGRFESLNEAYDFTSAFCQFFFPTKKDFMDRDTQALERYYRFKFWEEVCRFLQMYETNFENGGIDIKTLLDNLHGINLK